MGYVFGLLVFVYFTFSLFVYGAVELKLMFGALMLAFLVAALGREVTREKRG